VPRKIRIARTIKIAFQDSGIVGEALRRRDALQKHRDRCGREVWNCAKCARLLLHERMVDLRHALRHAQSAGITPAQLFEEMLAVSVGAT
jgi:hypothetical protein